MSGSDTPAFGGSLYRLIRKELREILRDRRTIITLVLMPLLVYPMLNLVFQRFLLDSLQPGQGEGQSMLIGVVRQQEGALIRGFLDASGPLRQGADEPPPDVVTTPDLKRAVEDMSVDLGIRVSSGPEEQRLTCELLYRTQSPASRRALEYFEEHVRAYNDQFLIQRLRSKGDSPVLPIQSRRLEVEGGTSFSLAALIPLILILMTVAGAVYPAIDLTAGERERGTLETLMAAPVSRNGLLVAKYTAVVCVALLTALVNLLAMTATILAGGLGTLLFGPSGLTLSTVVGVLLLLTLFAAFFSAVLLLLTSTARSFKEAQAYLIPLMLLSLGPGLLSLLPGLELGTLLAVTPLINIVLLARDLLQDQADLLPAAAALLSTVAYTAVAIGLAARLYGNDAVLSAGAGSWQSLRGAGGQVRAAPSMFAALLCLVLLFFIYYLLGGWLGQQSHWSMSARMAATAAITAVVFGGLPVVICMFERASLAGSFRIRRPAWPSLAAALVLGLSLWPFAHELVLLGKRAGMYTIDASHFEQVRLLLERWKTISPAVVILTFALVPAVFEELFFRGFLFSALSRRLQPSSVILATAALFGTFHVVVGQMLTPERFLPSTMLGLFLGWTAHRTSSVLPGMLLHLTHNSLLLLAAYYQDRLDKLLSQGGLGDEQSLPYSWLAAAAVGTAAGIALMIFAGSADTPPQPAVKAEEEAA